MIRIYDPNRIVAAVCQTSGVDHDELVGGVHRRGPRFRTRPVVMARQVAVYLLREYTALSYPQIAVLLERPSTSHSTMQDRYNSAWCSVKRWDVDFINAVDAAREALAGQTPDTGRGDGNG